MARDLTRYAWLSVATSLVTMGLKAGAWWLTDSVGLLSDALESLVNLAAALLALGVLVVAARPPDDEHAFGHEKAEYFSSGAEGGLILVAAISMAVPAGARLLHPQALQHLGLGSLLAFLAALLNFGTARVLLRAGRKHRSITLEADAGHLMTDVYSSAGVLLGLAAVWLTGWLPLDPLLGLAVAAQVAYAGVSLLRRSVLGLLDTALPPAQQELIEGVFARHRVEGVDFHALRTRMAGRSSYVNFHVLVPGSWSVAQGHDLCERLEEEIRAVVAGARVLSHLEPLEDSRSFEDIELDRS